MEYIESMKMESLKKYCSTKMVKCMELVHTMKRIGFVKYRSGKTVSVMGFVVVATLDGKNTFMRKENVLVHQKGIYMRQNKSKTAKSKTIPSQTTNHQKNIEYIEQKPSFGSSIFQGFTFGIGSSIARNTIDRLFLQKQPEQFQQSGKTMQLAQQKECDLIWENYKSCILMSSENSCQNFYEEFSKCHNQFKNTNQ